jgi:hypothetical protein
MTTRWRVLRDDGPNDWELICGPACIEPITVDEQMLLQAQTDYLKAHADYVRLGAFLKAHNFPDGLKNGKNPFIGEWRSSGPPGKPDPNPPGWLVEILIRKVARTLRAEPSIEVKAMWERLGRPVTWTRFRDGAASIWAKAYALAGIKRRRGPKKGPRKRK